MKQILLTLIIVFTLGSTGYSQDILQSYLAMKAARSEVLPVTVNEHPLAHETVKAPALPPYFAKKYLRGEVYSAWALDYNAYQDEVHNRAYSERTFYGERTVIRQTNRGAVIETTPRFWTVPNGTPGVMKYNPFVQPK